VILRAIGAPSTPDWLEFCRHAAAGVREVLAGYGSVEERGVATGRGEGGDTTLVIDAAAEDVIFDELEALGAPVVAVSEERGEVTIAGGGATRVVIDPVDGSLNAKRRLPFAAVSIAVASGPGMRNVEVGYVGELDPARDWWAVRGEGAFLDGKRLSRLDPGSLEMLGLEGVTPDRVAAAASAIGGLDARRVRALGSVAVTLCMVAAGSLDAMISLRPMRSVDAAAGQLLVREVGGAVLFPEAGPDAALDLDMRSRVIAARDAEMAERLLATF
jgi:myo-inositol-1(or 4)-monophosphatase